MDQVLSRADATMDQVLSRADATMDTTSVIGAELDPQEGRRFEVTEVLGQLREGDRRQPLDLAVVGPGAVLEVLEPLEGAVVNRVSMSVADQLVCHLARMPIYYRSRALSGHR